MARQLEIFAPRFEAADAALVERISTVTPALVSVSGGTAALRLCRKLQERGLKTQLHLTSDLTPDAASSCVDDAVAAGVTSFLVLDASAPSGDASTAVLDLVRLVKSKGGSLSVAVCGTTEKTDAAYDRKLAAVREQVQAGADSVIAGPVLSAEAFAAYESEVCAAGVTCAVTPSVLPLHALPSRAELRRVARGLGLVLPAALLEEIVALWRVGHCGPAPAISPEWGSAPAARKGPRAPNSTRRASAGKDFSA